MTASEREVEGAHALVSRILCEWNYLVAAATHMLYVCTASVVSDFLRSRYTSFIFV
ncbi:unnamed protein product [Ectocarpus sp. CCAP 1310/34]|nr:unnamed protein product [Ectocarpus sp. CCAP 1310/34]